MCADVDGGARVVPALITSGRHFVVEEA